MHDRAPSCGFFLGRPAIRQGSHLNMNLSMADYLTAPLTGGANDSGVTRGAAPRVFMPLTMRISRDQKAWSLRSSYADLRTPPEDRRVPRPVPTFPSGSPTDEWMPWEVTNVHEWLHTAPIGRPDAMPLDVFFLRVLGRPPPEVLYFAQGAQFAAHRDAIRQLPKATYEWLLSTLCPH